MVAPLDAVYYMIMNNYGPDYPRFRDQPIIINNNNNRVRGKNEDAGSCESAPFAFCARGVNRRPDASMTRT